MVVYRVLCLVTVLFVSSSIALFLTPSSSATGVAGVRKAVRYIEDNLNKPHICTGRMLCVVWLFQELWNIPWLGIGMQCNGCPPRSCEDDEAIIHGYCCGCAYASDKLPVMCPDFLQCPLNLHGLCHDYEYMMRCCC